MTDPLSGLSDELLVLLAAWLKRSGAPPVVVYIARRCGRVATPAILSADTEARRGVLAAEAEWSEMSTRQQKDFLEAVV